MLKTLLEKSSGLLYLRGKSPRKSEAEYIEELL
jgi:hypothetical protein